MTGRLAGRRVLVVGGASGIGEAAVRRMLGEGAQVAILDVQDLDRAPVSEVVSGHPRARYLECDVRGEEEVRGAVGAAADWLGGLDVVAQVAGIQAGRGVPVQELDLSTWDNVLTVNLRGAFLVVKHALPRMTRPGGVVILTSSGAGVFGGSGSFAYGSSKGGLHGFALTLEGPLRELGIRVNEVAPGMVDTPLMRAQIPAEELRKRKLLHPDAIGSVIAFLASTDADAVRGVVRTG